MSINDCVLPASTPTPNNAASGPWTIDESNCCDAIAEHEPSFMEKLKSLFSAEEYNADLALSVSWKGILTLVGSLAVIGVVGTRMIKKGE